MLWIRCQTCKHYSWRAGGLGSAGWGLLGLRGRFCKQEAGRGVEEVPYLLVQVGGGLLG